MYLNAIKTAKISLNSPLLLIYYAYNEKYVVDKN